jgi:hypothetical protein
VRVTGHESRVPARSVYELHLIHPATAQRHSQQLKNLLADFLLGGPIMGSPGNVFVKVTLEVVDVRTHGTVLTMDQRVEDAQGVVDLINADLDRLDAPAFAAEWSVVSDT